MQKNVSGSTVYSCTGSVKRVSAPNFAGRYITAASLDRTQLSFLAFNDADRRARGENAC
jgi:hypothetical protein